MRFVSTCISVAACLLLLLPLPAGAESRGEPVTSDQIQKEIEQLRSLLDRLTDANAQEIEELRERIAGLEAQLEQAKQKRQSEELESLREEAEKATAEEAEKDKRAEAQRDTFVGRQRNLQALNPEISFLGDVSYDATDNDVRDGFLVRGVEIAFQSPLDPYTRFKGFLAAHQEPPELAPEEAEDPAAELEEHSHEHGDEINVTVEEAYMEWVALPLNTRLRVGKFRQQFGTLNRWHPHALPSVDVPFALRNAFGHDGLVGLGVGLDWQLPRLWASSNGLTVEIVNADNASAFAGSEFRDPTFLLRHTGFFDLGPDDYLEIGLNAVTGPNDEEGGRDTTVSSVDFNYVWEPVARARYRGLEVRGEYLHTHFETEDRDAVRSDSFYTYLVWKLGRRWSVGLRYDDAELPWPRFELLDPQEFREGLRERGFSPFLTMWQSEFVRLRLELQHTSRDFVAAQGPDDDDRAFVQVTFAAGPHKHEAY